MNFLTCHLIVNQDLELVTVNKNYRQLLELKDSYSIEGKKVYELPHVISEQSEQLEDYNRLVMKEKKMISGLTIDIFNSTLKFIYNQNAPVYDNGIVVGCEIKLKEIEVYSTRGIILNNMPRAFESVQNSVSR